MRDEVDRYHEIGEALTALGYLWTRLNAGRRPGVRLAPKGWADFVGCSPTGQFVAVEVKREGQEPTSDQLAFGYVVERRGGRYLVVHGAAELIARLRHDSRVGT